MDDPAELIALLEQPDSTHEAAVRLRELAERDTAGIDRAIEPLIRAWTRDQREPYLLETAVAVARGASGGPYWDRVLPTLRAAVADVVVSDIRSLDSGLLAVDVLTRRSDRASLPMFIEIARRSVPDLAPGHRLRLATVHALGQFGDQPQAVTALIGLLKIAPGHRVQVLPAAAALALGRTRSPDAVVPLLEAAIRIPDIFPQCRRALVAIGKPAIPELIALLNGRQAQVNLLARDLELNVDCDQKMGLGTRCPYPGLLPYRAASLLAEFPGAESERALLRSLDAPARPALFSDSGPGADQHEAILEALGRVGGPSAARAVWSYAKDPSMKLDDRALAMEVYGLLSSDASVLTALAHIMLDSTQDATLRKSAAVAYSRIVRDRNALEPVKSVLAGVARPPDPADEGAGVEFALLARAYTGVACADDPACYAQFLERSADQVTNELVAYIPDLEEWPEPVQQRLVHAAYERALVELGKFGARARPVFDTLLERSDFKQRELRRAALSAMKRVAELPCDSCVARLDELIASESKDASLTWVSVETRLARDYFSWAGR